MSELSQNRRRRIVHIAQRLFGVSLAILLVFWGSSPWISATYYDARSDPLIRVEYGGGGVWLYRGSLSASGLGRPSPNRQVGFSCKINRPWLNPTDWNWKPRGKISNGPSYLGVSIWIPLWILIIATLPPTGLICAYLLRGRAGYCPKCQYDRRGLGETVVCPECGKAIG